MNFTLCNICSYYNYCTICNKSSKDYQIVPDRSIQEINNNNSWLYDVMCPLCFDSFLEQYNGIFYKIRLREILGKMISKQI